MSYADAYREIHRKFLNRVERFIAKHDMAPSRFGREAANDPPLVFDLRAGRALSPESMGKVEMYMLHYKSRASSEASTVHAAE